MKVFIDKAEAIKLAESGVEETQPNIEYLYERLQKRKTLAELELDEKQDIMLMRKSWSKWILWSIIFIVVCDEVIIFLIGFNRLNFQNGYAVPAFIGESIIKIIVLAVIIVKFLFNSDSKK
jgi:hypothetical protein